MADSVDIRRMRQNREDEKRAFHTCQECIARHGLEMKLVEAEYTLDLSLIHISSRPPVKASGTVNSTMKGDSRLWNCATMTR